MYGWFAEIFPWFKGLFHRDIPTGTPLQGTDRDQPLTDPLKQDLQTPTPIIEADHPLTSEARAFLR